MTSPSTFTFLVNSCDVFADTWPPFFELYRVNCRGLDTQEIVLVTDHAGYSHEGLEIRSTGLGRKAGEMLPWSARLIDALDSLEGDLVLYVQDDYFIEEPVDADMVNRMAQRMLDDPTIDRIGLTHEGSRGPFKPTDDPDLWEVAPKADYRITTQASLWRIDVLKSYLRADENVWMFEIYGTRRAWRRKNRFLTVSLDRPQPIVYTLTGIIKGKWHRAMPALFERFGIPMDFERRGFYDEPPLLQRRWKTFRTLLADPGRLLKGLRGR